MLKLILTLVLLAVTSGPALACGSDTDCIVGERTYRIKMPEDHDGTTPVGAIVHTHGYRGTAAGVMRNRGLSRIAAELGVAIIAPKSAADDWVIPGAPRKTGNDGSAEFTYFEAMLDDVARRFPIDRSRLMASGFSAGGMMVWNLACQRGGLFAGYVPVAGTFWQPVPQTCDTAPVNLIHIHGTSDTVVPLEGRAIADTAQGSVTQALEMLAATAGYGDAVTSETEKLDCTRRSGADGHILEFCLHPGGHSFRPEWLKRAWREFEAIGAL
jgi:polyhydroxybutyrate depolymerase